MCSVRISRNRYGYLGSSSGISGKRHKPNGGGEAGAKRVEGEIKGCGCDEVKSLSELGPSLDTVGSGYPANSVGAGRVSGFFVVDHFYA
jgi:hypothetical protein